MGSPALLAWLAKFFSALTWSLFTGSGLNQCKYFDTPVPLNRMAAAGYQQVACKQPFFFSGVVRGSVSQSV